MATIIYSQRNNDNKLYTSSGSKKYNAYNQRQNAKTSYNKQSYNTEFNYEYNTPAKKNFQFERLNKVSTSGYSTMDSETNQEPELTGFKVVQSGKTLFEVQTSDSDGSFSPFERKESSEGQCYASALNFQSPVSNGISLPSFL